MRIYKSLLTAVILSTLATPSVAKESYTNWLNTFKQEAVDQGIDSKLLNKAFKRKSPYAKIIELDNKQPEGTLTLNQYLDRVVTKVRIKTGRARLKENKALLDKVSKKYGVQPQFIVALWGVETDYGRLTGGYPVVDALATLAYDGRRGAFFRKELHHALKILQEGHIPVERFSGSWAGAMGQSQFMPSSFNHYAVDENGDGRRDIWQTREDVFGSIANYLSKHGWDDSQNWGREVKLPSKPFQLNRKAKHSFKEWAKAGITNIDGTTLPSSSIQARLVSPDKTSGRTFLVYKNFDTVLKWNRSNLFATAVGTLADGIK